MHPLISILGYLVLAAVFSAGIWISTQKAHQVWQDWIAPVHLKYLLLNRDNAEVSQRKTNSVKDFFNHLDRSKRAADNDLKSIFQNEMELEIAREINDYSFRIFRDLWLVQREWFKSNDRFFQGKDTIIPAPNFGSGGKVDYGFGLTDQVETWSDIGYLDKEAPVSIRSDVYEGPQGHGYTISVSFTFNGEIWKMQMHQGPEDRGASFVWNH